MSFSKRTNKTINLDSTARLSLDIIREHSEDYEDLSDAEALRVALYLSMQALKNEDIPNLPPPQLS